MITVKLMGGLGNQMFQYAVARSLSKAHNTTMRLDLTYLLDRRPREDCVYRNYDLGIFNISENFTFPYMLTKLIGNLKNSRLTSFLTKFSMHNKKIFSEKHFYYHNEITSLENNVYLSGHWQSPKYFSDIVDIIRQEFTFRKPIADISAELLKKILKKNSVCVNVRRADFINLKNANKNHGVLDMEYYNKAIGIIAKKVETPHFFIFSDDVDWCTKNIKPDFTTTVVSHKHAGEKFKDYLQLMLSCKHFIIPNSTFGWWAAWLNTNKDKIVIAPKNWFKDKKKNAQTMDLMPSDWLRI